MDRGVGIIAVSVVRDVSGWLTGTRGPRCDVGVPIPVAIRVAVVGTEGHSLVNLPVAVVVLAIAGFDGVWVDRCIVVVAVSVVRDVAGRGRTGRGGACRIPVSVPVYVFVVGSRTSGRVSTGTVIINTVVTVRIVRDIAVRGHAGLSRFAGVAIPILVRVAVVGLGVIRCLPVAVVIDLISADFCNAWVDGGVGVVAVSSIGHISVRRGTGDSRLLRISVSVAVRIFVGGLQGSLVDLIVAVVIRAVTDLASTRTDRFILIVAVPASGNIAVGG